MMNMIWAGMILLGICFALLTGNMELVTSAAIESGKDAVNLCITMMGVMGLWVGIMEIAKEAGLLSALTRGISPFIQYLFPELPKGEKARDYIATNMVANILGLGWAATPAGLKAMEALSEFDESCRKTGRASNAMCTFLILNISSLQLIPVNIIAYRSQYGSANPVAVIVPGILATLCSTGLAVIFCRIMDRTGK